MAGIRQETSLSLWQIEWVSFSDCSDGDFINPQAVFHKLLCVNMLQLEGNGAHIMKASSYLFTLTIMTLGITKAVIIQGWTSGVYLVLFVVTDCLGLVSLKLSLLKTSLPIWSWCVNKVPRHSEIPQNNFTGQWLLKIWLCENNVLKSWFYYYCKLYSLRKCITLEQVLCVITKKLS